MLFLPCFQAPAVPIQSQFGEATPVQLEALLRAKDWPGVADWFEGASPSVRGKYHEIWIQSLNRSRRWERLLAVCEALQPQLEAKSGPRLGTYRLYRAQALSQLGRHGEAALAHAENGRLGYPDGLPNACAEARLAQDWPNLLTFSEEVLAKRPGEAAALAGKGEALARMDRMAEAEPQLRAALDKDPNLPYAWNNLGRCLNERHAWAEACEALDRALTLDPKQAEALFNRGRAQFELKHYAASRDDFRAALTLLPGDPVLTENLRQAERHAAVIPAAASKPAPRKK
jgi:tetratricopeptide (TPR) repeat protein